MNWFFSHLSHVLVIGLGLLILSCDVQFEQMKADLRRTHAIGGMKHRIVGAAGVAEVTFFDEDEFAPFSEKQFKQVKADLREGKATPARRRDGKLIAEGKTPWLRDHSMALYVEKIQTYFWKTESK